MGKRFRTCSLDQPFLMPPSLQDWLPENHLARFVADVVQQLDLSEIYDHYEHKDGRGLAAYHPEMLTRLLLYGYAIGESSSRRIEQATYDDVAFRYLAADQHPDHDTIASFRQQHLESLGRMFVQALRLCQRAGLVKLGHVAIDGTKLEANASRCKSMTYGQLSEQEQSWKQKVDELLRRAGEVDKEEDCCGGQGQPANPLPEELARAQSRLKRLGEAKRELEEEARQRWEEAQRAWSSRGKQGRPRKGEEPRRSAKECRRQGRGTTMHGTMRPAQAEAEPHGSRLPTDARQWAGLHRAGIQRATGSGCGSAGDRGSRSNTTSDRSRSALGNAGQGPEVVTADAGYWDTETVQQAIGTGGQVLVSPDGAVAWHTGQPQ